MRETIYAHLSKLYAQGLALFALLAAFIGAVYPKQVRELIGERLTVETILSGIAFFLAFLALYFYLLWVMKPSQIIEAKVEKASAEKHTASIFPVPKKPTPDTSLKSVRNRVIAHLGGVPHSGAASITKQQKADRDEFHKKVDLEILDQVSHHRMNVWGRYGDGARRRLTRYERMRFDHRNDAVSMMGDALRAMIFKDIMFDGEEVKAVWPSKAGSS
jgi:Na+-transporting methylmalonyl-CoA/oxaloacetate decarboxylase gamma subunit|tara:strand:- start:40319 stop:40969 length:651 start_codon:yes stop_codon:yes gene_type:complete